MSDVAKVTVITPVKNILDNQLAERFLACASSVATQTYPNIEHIVIDGGSVDGTLVILTTQPSLRYEVYPTESKIEAMNYALSKAEGDYILFLYADDCLNENTAIEKMVKTLEENKADFVFGPAMTEVPMGGKSKLETRVQYFFGQEPFAFQTALFKKELFQKIGDFDSSKLFGFKHKFLLKLFLDNYYGVDYKETLVTIFGKIPSPERIKFIREEEFDVLKSFYETFPAYSDEKIKNMLEYGSVDTDLYRQVMEKINPTMRESIDAEFQKKQEQNNCWPDFYAKGYRQLFVPLQGIGDALTFQAVTKALFEKIGHKILVAHKNKSLFENNPYVEVTDAVFEAPNSLTDLQIARIERAGFEIIVPIYYNVEKLENGKYEHFYPDCHLIARTAAVCGLNEKIDLKPVMYLTDEEKKYGRFAPEGKKQVAIMSGACEKVKFWPYFQDVVDALKVEYYFVQVGALNDTPLNGVSMHLEGKTSLRQTASVLYNSDLFVGEIGGLMHMARAVDCPAVIAYSSSEPDYFVNYIANTNVHPKKVCPTFLKYGTLTGCLSCLDCFVCVRSIDPKEVIEAVREKLKNPIQRPLPVETVEVKSAFRLNSIQKFRERHAVYFKL